MTTSKHAGAVATLASLAVLAACGGGTDTSLSPAKLQQVGTPTLQGHPNAKLPDSIKVKVLTGDDQPVSNATVQWVARTGGGAAGAGTNNTNADGIAANTWTLGPATGDQEAGRSHERSTRTSGYARRSGTRPGRRGATRRLRRLQRAR
jgi:hypothetical protein